MRSLIGSRAAVGAPAPHVIVVGSEFGAHSGSVGLRRQRVLWLGLALFGALPPQQRVALLANQLGHFVNGDVRRLGLTQPALTTLGKLSGVFAAPAGGWTMRDPMTGRSPLSLTAMEMASTPRASSFALAHRLRLPGRGRWFCRGAYGGDNRDSTRLATGAILRRSTHGPGRGHRIDRGISQRSPWRAGHGQCHRQKRPLGRDGARLANRAGSADGSPGSADHATPATLGPT